MNDTQERNTTTGRPAGQERRREFAAMKKYTAAAAVFWLIIVGASLAWNLTEENNAQYQIALRTAQSFFRQIVLTRTWNSEHGGIYAPVSGETQSNPYLASDPLRDLEAGGLKLTKINPAYMTRQISEIAAREEGVRFHITSLKPLRPENKAEEWEAEWLASFAQGVREQGAFIGDGQELRFRYMAPLTVQASCLQCHSKYGYKPGDIIGGISVTMPFSPKNYLPLAAGYGIAALTGLMVIIISGHLLSRKQEALSRKQEALEQEIETRSRAEHELQNNLEALRQAMSEIKTLRGIIPICSICKQIREDSGYWNQIENYIHDHAGAEFTHSICPECFQKLYPDMACLGKVQATTGGEPDQKEPA
jgi:hypothetical protein